MAPPAAALPLTANRCYGNWTSSPANIYKKNFAFMAILRTRNLNGISKPSGLAPLITDKATYKQKTKKHPTKRVPKPSQHYIDLTKRLNLIHLILKQSHTALIILTLNSNLIRNTRPLETPEKINLTLNTG